MENTETNGNEKMNKKYKIKCAICCSELGEMCCYYWYLKLTFMQFMKPHPQHIH